MRQRLSLIISTKIDKPLALVTYTTHYENETAKTQSRYEANQNEVTLFMRVRHTCTTTWIFPTPTPPFIPLLFCIFLYTYLFLR
eukprot:m.144374 g.144374  ORF g.144374 m.144374 type:complete len:84 (+) comp30368_c0_seq1:427-678(+)